MAYLKGLGVTNKRCVHFKVLLRGVTVRSNLSLPVKRLSLPWGLLLAGDIYCYCVLVQGSKYAHTAHTCDACVVNSGAYQKSIAFSWHSSVPLGSFRVVGGRQQAHVVNRGALYGENIAYLARTNAMVGGEGPFLRTLFCSGLGSLARVTPPFHAVISFRAALYFPYKSPTIWLAIDCRCCAKQLPNVFLSARYRANRASGSDPY